MGTFLLRCRQATELVGAVLLALLLAVTAVDVVGRYFFSAPIRGAFHMVAGLMALTFFVGLPLVTARDEHLKAGLIDHLLTGRVEQVVRPLVEILSFVGLATLGWRLFVQAERFSKSGASLASVDVPLSALAYVGAVSALVSAGIVLCLALRRLSRPPA